MAKFTVEYSDGTASETVQAKDMPTNTGGWLLFESADHGVLLARADLVARVRINPNPEGTELD